MTFTDVTAAVLAALTAVVIVQVNVRASVRTALQRSAAVVVGVLMALAIGDALTLNAFTVALLVGVSLALAQLVLRLPAAAARQVPISVLVVLTTVAANPNQQGWQRAGETLIGATVGVVMSLALPASRLVDGRQTVQRLGDGVCEVLRSMALGLQEPWSTDQTRAWRRVSHTARTGSSIRPGKRSATVATPRSGTSATDATSRSSVATRTPCPASSGPPSVCGPSPAASTTTPGSHEPHRAMPAMGALFDSLAAAIVEHVRNVLGATHDAAVVAALDEVHARRERLHAGRRSASTSGTRR